MTITKINDKVSALSTDVLKDMAAQLFTDNRDGADMVLGAVLIALEARLPEDQYIAFCDGIQ